MQIRSRRKKQARYSPYQINLADQLLKGLKRKGYRFLMKYLPLPSLTTMERFKNKYYFWQKESYVHLMNQDNQNSSIDCSQTVSVDSEIVKQEEEDLMFIQNEKTEKLVSNKNNKSESIWREKDLKLIQDISKSHDTTEQSVPGFNEGSTVERVEQPAHTNMDVFSLLSPQI